MLLEYDGTDFHGSQAQAGLRTVQGVLQDLLWRVTGEAIVVEFAGRTDAGVHAAGQVACFRTGFRHGGPALGRALNALAPRDLAVLNSVEVDDAFSARRSARSRWYRYTVQTGAQARPLARRFSSFQRGTVDLEAMQHAASELLGTHDFSAFGDMPNERSSPVRRVEQAEVRQAGDLVHIDLTATAFLRHMARSMAGLLLRAGNGAIEPGEVARVLRERDRASAGPVLPARGLCLMGVAYNDSYPMDRPDDGSSRPGPVGPRRCEE